MEELSLQELMKDRKALAPVEVKQVAIDKLKDLIALEDMIRETIDEWKDRLVKVQEQIQQAVGDADEATVDGRVVRTWRRTESFRAGEFAKAYPNLAQAFTSLVEKPVLDSSLVRAYNEDIYRQFQSRSWRRVE